MGGNSSVKVRFRAAFSLLLYRVLKVVTSLAMSISTSDVDALESDFNILTGIARFVTETRLNVWHIKRSPINSCHKSGCIVSEAFEAAITERHALGITSKGDEST